MPWDVQFQVLSRWQNCEAGLTTLILWINTYHVELGYYLIIHITVLKCLKIVSFKISHIESLGFSTSLSAHNWGFRIRKAVHLLTGLVPGWWMESLMPDPGSSLVLFTRDLVDKCRDSYSRLYCSFVVRSLIVRVYSSGFKSLFYPWLFMMLDKFITSLSLLFLSRKV